MPPKAPHSGLIRNCTENGVLGVIAGLVGVVQALQVIQLITDDKSFEPLIEKLWLMDGKTPHSRILQIPKANNCPDCSQPKENIILKETSVSCLIPNITTVDYCSLSGDHLLVVVREENE